MNQDEGTHAKRKKYAPDVYANLLQQLTSLMEEVPKLKPDRDAWDIEGEWSSTGVIYFVDAAYQSLFESIRDFDCRTIKLVNLDRPAARVTFYRKHRYKLLKDKDILPEDKATQIQSFITDARERVSSLEKSLSLISANRIVEIKKAINDLAQKLALWQDILNNLEQYELTLSNYSRHRMYVTVNYKYKLPSGEYANEQEHLLNTQRDRVGNMTQVRYNILFIDTADILREHPYQNREIENYLQGFPLQTQCGELTMYARLKPEVPIIQSFNQ